MYEGIFDIMEINMELKKQVNFKKFSREKYFLFLQNV